MIMEVEKCNDVQYKSVVQEMSRADLRPNSHSQRLKEANDVRPVSVIRFKNKESQGLRAGETEVPAQTEWFHLFLLWPGLEWIRCCPPVLMTVGLHSI